MSLQEVLRAELIRRMGFNKNDVELAIAEAVAEAVGATDDPEGVTEKIIDKVLDDMSPEIVRNGASSIGGWFKAFGYDYMRETLLKAAESCR